MKSNSKPENSAAALTAVAKTTKSAAVPASSNSDCETVSRRYQVEVLSITIFGVVAFVVFIKYVIAKYFAELEAIENPHSEF